MVNREALWKVLRLYYVDGKLLSGIESIYFVRVKWCDSEWFRIDSGVRRVYNVPLALQCIYGCSGENGDGKVWSEIPGGGGGRVEIT